jgi:hypothetical protein
MGNSKLVLAGLATLAAFTLACGGGTTVSSGDSQAGAPAGADTATTSAAVLSKKIGEAIDVTTDSTAITYKVTKTETKAGSEFNKPGNGVWLLAYLEVNVSKGSAFVCSCELSFIASDGSVYESGYASFDGRKEFASADIAAGQKSAGWVFFDVPKGAKGKIQLKVFNLLGDNQYAYWTL